MAGIIIVWILFAISSAMIANSRGNSGAIAFFLSIILSPIIGMTWAISTPVNTAKLEQAAIDRKVSKRCDTCSGVVRSSAKACRHCGGTEFTTTL